jgi:hypothetical protein
VVIVGVDEGSVDIEDGGGRHEAPHTSNNRP